MRWSALPGGSLAQAALGQCLTRGACGVVPRHGEDAERLLLLLLSRHVVVEHFGGINKNNNV